MSETTIAIDQLKSDDPADSDAEHLAEQTRVTNRCRVPHGECTKWSCLAAGCLY
jgi:iron-sulfur cluster repair protein YtfE (RIC family)